MSLKLPNLDDLPPAERAEKLRQIEAFLLEVVYSKILPAMPLSQQIETLQTLEKLGANQHTPIGTPTNTDDDATFLSDVMSQLNEVLS